MGERAIATQYASESSEDSAIVDRARECAKLSKPWLLPEEGHQADDEFENNYQSVGSNGLTVFTGKLMDMVFPAGRPFFRLEPSPQIKYAPDQDDAVGQARLQALFLRELTMMAVLETGDMKRGSRRSRRVSFRTKKYQALLQCVGTGDVLEQLTDDYKIKVFRRDQWTCRRDSSGDPMHFIVKENADIFAIRTGDMDNAKFREEVGLADVEEDNYEDRMQDMFTRCMYQPVDRTWKIEQEVNGVIFNESIEPVSPFFSTPYELVSPEHYGRGLVENNLGDLSGLNELEKDLLNLMEIASKWHPVIDPSSDLTPKDLEQPTGTVLSDAVAGGVPSRVGILSMALPREYTILASGIERKTQQLGQAMLTEIEAMPQGERVTATQVVRIAREIELATGGVISAVSDDQQIPLLQRLEYQMLRDKMLNPLPDESYEIVSITGVNAIRHGERAQAALTLAQIVSQLPEKAQRKIDSSVLVDVLARHSNVYEPGLIKTNQQVDQEIRQENQQALAAQVGAKAVDVLGNAAEHELTQEEQAQ